MNHHGKHVDDGRTGHGEAHDGTPDGGRRPSEYERGTTRPDNPQAEHEDRSQYTHDGGQVGGGIGATHDGGVLGGAGREGDRDGSNPPDAPQPGAGVDYSTGHGFTETGDQADVGVERDKDGNPVDR